MIEHRDLARTRQAIDSARARLADLITWSWKGIGSELVDGSTDPRSVLSFVEPGTEGCYWELHFEDARITRTDFLQRPSLSPIVPVADGSPDPVLGSLREWYSSGETAQRCHASAWLELDGPLSTARPARLQGVSICLDPYIGTSRAGDPAVLAHPEASVLRLFERLQHACGVQPRGGTALQQIRTAAVACGGMLRHLSVMRGRDGSPIKLYVAVPKPALASFLRAIAWPGDIPEALGWTALVCARSSFVHLDIELRDQLTQRLGCELFADPSPAADPLRKAATRTAVEMGLMTADQVLALESWVGEFRKSLGDDLWPTKIRRWFDLKFVAYPGSRKELKAYLGFAPCQGIF